jgi:hypothetical protein
MFGGSDENNPLLINLSNKKVVKCNFENKLKFKHQSAFKIVSRVEKKPLSKKILEIKKMSKLDLSKLNIEYRKDKNIVDKLFEYKNKII